MSNETNGTWLTKEAFDRLSAELAHLEGPYRTEIAERIAQARDEGDLKENGGYHAAREEQGKNEARINELKAILKDAVVGEGPTKKGVVEPGTVVTISMLGKERTFLLGNREIADSSEELEVFSPESPLGKALLGAKVKDTVSYEAPNGKELEVKVLKAEPYKG